MRHQRVIIKLTEHGQALEVPELVALFQDTVGMLKEIDCDITTKSTPFFKWHIVSIQKGSPLLATMEAVSTGGDGADGEPDVAGNFIRGLREIGRGANRPAHFGESTLTRVKRVAAMRVKGLYVEYKGDGEKPVRVTPDVAIHVDEITGADMPDTYDEEAELDGRLLDVSLHPSVPQFAIYDPLTDRRVRCDFSDDRLSEVADLLKTRARLLVVGLAHYSQNNPVSIKVRDFRRLREQNELPQVDDLRRAKIDITGGKLPEDYIRELRDE